MLISNTLLDELFRAFHIQRWNDRLRPMNFFEMDKHSHKMIIAYCFAKYEEQKGEKIDWILLIKHGIFELLRRIIISDIKSPIFREIKKNKKVYNQLNEFVLKELKNKINNKQLIIELEDFLFNEQKRTLTQRILDSAHIYSSFLEFELIKNTNPYNFQNIKIEAEILNDINSFSDLIGIKKLTNKETISNFIDLCGQLRFQIRWAQTPRVPQTSVLGHSLLVAIISFFITFELPHCNKRLYNNFFGGLFHDLPEAVTRDIILPVKKSSQEFDKLIKKLERKLAEEEIFPLVDQFIEEDIKYFIQNEFSNKIKKNGKLIDKNISTDDINEKYNEDEYSPYDGEIIKIADEISAFLEAWHSCNSGIKSNDLIIATEKIRDRYSNKKISNVIDLNNLFNNYQNLTNTSFKNFKKK